MNNKIVLSIVIPTHNSQNTITHLLISIHTSQFKFFKNIEVVVIDDASSDNTKALVRKLLEKLKFKLVLYPVRKNVGPAKARNYGVKKAKGKYVLFLDSDVVLAKSTLRYTYSFAKEGKIKAFTGIWHYQQKSTKFFPNFKAMRDWVYWFIEREKYARYYLFSTRIAGIEKKLFQKIGGFDETFSEPTVEDIELTYRIEKHAKIRFSPEIMVNHEFEDFWPVAVKYFKRSRDWILLYQKRLRFDPVATSKKEAFKAILAAMLVFFLLLGFTHWLFFYIALLIALQFTNLEWYFWTFVYKQKGLVFLLESIIFSIILYLIIDLGSFWGLVLSRIK